MEEIGKILLYIKRFKLKSIFINYFKVSFLLIMSFAVVLFCFFAASDPKRQEIIEENAIMGDRIRDYIDSELDELNSMATLLMADTDIRIMLDSETPMFRDRHGNTYIMNFQKVCTTLMRTKAYISSIHVYSYKSDFVYSSKGNAYWDVSIYKKVLEQGIESLKKNMPGIKTYRDEVNDAYISISFPLDVFENTGIILFVLDAQSFCEEITDIYNEFSGSCVYVQNTGEIIYSDNMQEFGKNINNTDYIKADARNASRKIEINGKKAYAHSASAKLSNGVAVISYNSENVSNINLPVILITAFFALFISLLIAATVAVKLFRPIEEILKTVRESEIDVDLHNSSENELDYIVNKFMANIKQNIKMRQELMDTLMSLKDAQTIALNSQITPHFLFNALQTINMAALDIFKEENEITDYIKNLSDMLRISLRSDNYIPFSLEVKHAKIYSKMKSQMHKSRIKINWNLGEFEYSEIMVPKIILQPLIENAIEHGALKADNGGTVEISAYRTDREFIITVVNDGKAISEEDEIRINNYLNEKNIKSDHIGLYNVNSRIKLVHGDGYGCHIEKRGDKTATVICFPFKG